MSLISLIFKSFRRIAYIVTGGANNLYTKYIFTGNDVVYKSFHTNGIPFVMVGINPAHKILPSFLYSSYPLHKK